MSYESDIHPSQAAILRHLLFVPHARFAELQKQTDLTSDHFNFHIKKLIEAGYVAKDAEHYALTRHGKEYANRMDTDEYEIERQPKISVILFIERQNEGRREFLVQQRLKQPYYGFWGCFGGKIRWGETFEAAASRELTEETGLHGSFTYSLLLHVHDRSAPNNPVIEDKVFIVMSCNNATGELISDFEGGHNAWLTAEELLAKDKLFAGAADLIQLIDNGITYHVREDVYNHEDY